MSETSDDGTAEQLSYLQHTPVEEIVANHFFVLLQVAAVRLAATPPQLDAAQLVIDLMAAMITTGGDRLGEHVDLFRNALAEVQQVFVRAASARD